MLWDFFFNRALGLLLLLDQEENLVGKEKYKCFMCFKTHCYCNFNKNFVLIPTIELMDSF